MEEVRVLGRLQPDTEGGLVPANGSVVCATLSVPLNSRRRSKAGRKMAVAKNKEAAGSFTGDIGVTKAEVGNKEAAGSFTGDIGVTKAELGNKEPAGSFGEIGVTKAELGNKEAAGTGMVTEPAEGTDPEPKAESKAEPEVVAITKETVPEALITAFKLYPTPRPRPIPERYLTNAIVMSGYAQINAKVDLEEDCLEQHANNGYAEVGVDFTDGVKRYFVLPKAGIRHGV